MTAIVLMRPLRLVRTRTVFFCVLFQKKTHLFLSIFWSKFLV